MIGRPTGIPRRQCPRLEGLREEVVNGNYTLVMEFMNRNNLSDEQWLERETKFSTFFGPGISAKVRVDHFAPLQCPVDRPSTVGMHCRFR